MDDNRRYVADDMDEALPGFRYFHPTDEELLELYRRRREAKKRSMTKVMFRFLNLHEPDDMDEEVRLSEFLYFPPTAKELLELYLRREAEKRVEAVIHSLGLPLSHVMDKELVEFHLRREAEKRFEAVKRFEAEIHSLDLPLFHDMDEELLEFHLRRKVEKRSNGIIQQMDLYRFDPWDLPSIEPSTVGEKEWYFFSNINRGRMYRSFTRITQNGYWKATEMDKPIYSSGRSKLIGFKRSLAFYRAGTPAAGKSRKTDWTMHEFRLPETIDRTRPPNGLEPKTIFRARRSIYHNSWDRKYEHSSEPMQDHIDWRMLYNSSFHHFDPSSNSNRDRNANEGATLGAIKEPFDESEIKREENVLETRIDIDHLALAAKMRPMIWGTVPNPSSADSFYTVISAILAITGQAAFTLISMSNSPTLNCVGASTVVGFLGAFSAMLLRDRWPKVARYLGKVSVVIGAASVVVGYAAHFHSDLSWSWGVICGFALLIPSVAVLFA